MSEETSNIETFPGGTAAATGLGGARQMPNNLPAEQNLLGALLLDNDVMERIDDRLRAEHFYDPLRQDLFHDDAVDRPWPAGRSCDPENPFSAPPKKDRPAKSKIILVNSPTVSSASRSLPTTP